MVKFIKNLLLYWRFKKAIKKCDKANARRGSDKYIVVNIVGYPYIINRKAFRKLRTQGVFSSNLKWQKVYEKRVTSNTLQKWIS